MSNAVDFISSYNAIDARMRAIYRGKGNLQFTDLVRRLAEGNATVAKYEDDLLAFAKLRNAIVHESSRDRIIAEPCDDVTRLIAHIAELLVTPPRLCALREKNVRGVDADETLADALIRSAETGHSNLPVYRGERVIGMLNNRRFVRLIGRALKQGEDIEATLSAPCSAVVSEDDLFRFYKVLGKNDEIQSAINAFEENRKLLAVIVTESGAFGDRIVNLITSSDLPALFKMLEE